MEQLKLEYIDLEYKKLRLLLSEQEAERKEWSESMEREKARQEEAREARKIQLQLNSETPDVNDTQYQAQTKKLMETARKSSSSGTEPMVKLLANYHGKNYY